MRTLVRIIRLPVDDYLIALNACLAHFTAAKMATAVIAFAVSWWIYVPIHELLHAFGCWVTGGAVTRLEIGPMYGASLLQRVFPFVVVGSEYAGQLTGFDTHGNDLTYLATDLMPFTLTVLMGVPMLCAAGRRVGAAALRTMLFGAALPIAYAPFISFTGDYYEIGSILVTRAVALRTPYFDVSRWRSDDVFKLIGKLSVPTGAISTNDAVGVLASFLVGCGLAFATYWLGTLWARLIVPMRSAEC